MLNFVHCCVLSIADFEQVNANWNKSNPSYFCTKILQIFEKFLIKIPYSTVFCDVEGNKPETFKILNSALFFSWEFLKKFQIILEAYDQLFLILQ